MLRTPLASLALARRVLASSILLGPLYVLGLAAWSARGDVDGHVDGRTKLAVVAFALAVGLVVGIVADVLVWARAREAIHAGRPRVARAATWRGLVGDLVEAASVVALLHGALVMWSMADSPELYAARWYARGGLARLVQIVATDVLGRSGVVAASALAVLVYVRPAPLAVLARRVGQRARPLFAALGVIAILLLPAAARPAPSSAPAVTSEAPRPNVLVLVAGSLRADRLDPRLTPNLVRLAERGTRFDRAYVSSPRTFPSWVTILTGRHAHHHGIRSELASPGELARDFDALPGRLARAGWATAAVSDQGGEVFARVPLGFDAVEAPSSDLRHLARARFLERQTPLLPVLHSRLGRNVFPAMRALPGASDPRLLAGEVTRRIHALRDRPFFLTAYFGVTRAPYAAPYPYSTRFTEGPYRGLHKYGAAPVSDARPPDDDVRRIHALYDGAVAAFDDAVGRILAALESEGLRDRTIVVITSDHGEALHEHGRGRGHGDHLFGDEATHVPLVVVDPRLDEPSANRTEARVVRDVDLTPTLYDLTGVAPPDDLDGRSLAPALRGEAITPRFAYAETGIWATEDVAGLSSSLRVPYPALAELTALDPESGARVLRPEMVPITRMARHRMVRDERYKLVYVPTRSGPRRMLFDTTEDPGETRDLAAERPADVTRLDAELWRWMLEDAAMERRGDFLLPRAPHARRASP